MWHRRRMAVLSAAGLIIAGLGWSSGILQPAPELAPRERFQIALQALDRRDFRTVSREIDALAAVPGFEPHVHLLRGGLFLRTGMKAEAVQQFAMTTPKGELRIPALLMTCECLYALGRLAEAEACIRPLTREHPDNADAHRWLGAIYYDLGHLDAAIRELARVTQLSPEDYRPRRLLGLIYFDFQQYPAAIEQYRQALANNPPESQRREIIIELAQSLIHQHEYAEALEQLTSASLDPDALYLALQSECHWSLGRRERARELLDRAAAHNPDEKHVLRLQGRMLSEAGDLVEAADALQQALAQNPHDFESRYVLANVYRQQGRTADYEVELARTQESRDMLLRLSKLNRRAAERPRDAQVRRDLAELCQTLGKIELSKMWRQAARAIDAGAAVDATR